MELEKDKTSQAALTAFQEIMEQEKEKGEWGFKSAKKIIKIYFLRKDNANLIKAFKNFLTYLRNVTRNESEKAIQALLELVSQSDQPDLLLQIYQITLDAMKLTKNEGLWLKTSLRLAQLYMTKGEVELLSKTLAELHAACRRPDGSDDESKSTVQLQVYCLEIQMVTQHDGNNVPRLKALFNRASNLATAIAPPHVHAVVNECGGHIYLRERDWDNARNIFFKAFINYNEASSPQRVVCLKYHIIANALRSLHSSDKDKQDKTQGRKINPFDTRETKAFINDPGIQLMKEINEAYMNDDLKAFERLLSGQYPHYKREVEEDKVLRHHMPLVLNNIRVNVLLLLLQPYTRLSIGFIAKELNMPNSEVEGLLVSLILDGLVVGHIDQIKQILDLGGTGSKTSKYKAIASYSQRLEQLARTVCSKAC
eukprot:gnl/Hemi2/10078_TR3491_c0_g1_i1.p1 gnl/Hemi2/10078_TR3491_c0_g1~~gnl/Hemi2/10078_TR3491_c0_g1_i1.p1  ORF type:complete len:477 (-),score=215.63 gnl/Hemi2/10078_TR3491_c0_g1_i1:88-1362(-)